MNTRDRMERYTQFLLKHRKLVISVFAVAAAAGVFLSGFVGVNYDFTDYLPDDARSTKALDIMEEEYSQTVPNVRVMIRDASIAQALQMKEELQAVDGVEEVNWLDDTVNIYAPLETAAQETIDEWYKDGNALFSITVSDEMQEEAVPAIREVIGGDNYMEGSAVTHVLAPVNTSRDVQKIMLLVIPIVFAVLIVTTDSWFEPVLFMITIGVAIFLNMGTNLIFGTISFVTNAAGSVLQLAVSMDYSIFLLHRFSENRGEGRNVEEAMIAAVKQSVGSIFSSGLTTVTGFIALVLMRFKIGPDMGWAMAKAILFSLASVLCFLPALAISCYRLIDKTHHRSLLPKFDKLAAFVIKIRIPMLLVFCILLAPGYQAQRKNDFLYGGSEVYNTDATQMGRDMLAINAEYGASNPVVLMVPKGDLEKENALNKELLNLDYVTSIISYVNTVGASIPTDFLPEDTVSKLYSEHYSRFVITLDAQEKDPDWYIKVNGIRSLGEKYYGDQIQLAGDLVSTEDLKATVLQDNVKVNILAIGFVFLILLVNFRSLSIPVILTGVIEASIWINLTIPYLRGQTMFYIAYLIISSVQLGATIDYAILFTDRYKENRQTMPKKEAALKTLSSCTVSILTSAVILTSAGLDLGILSTNGVISQLGILVGRGAFISFLLVIFVLPTLLMLFDGLIRHTSYKIGFYKGGIKE